MKVQWMFRAAELRTEQRLRGVLTVFARDPENAFWALSFSFSGGESVLQRAKLVFLTEERLVTDMPCPFDRLSADLGTVRYLALVDEVPAAGDALGGDAFMLMRRLPVSATTIRTVIGSVSVNPRAKA